MQREDFEALVRRAYHKIPAPFRAKIKNVAFLVEGEPSREDRRAQGLSPHDTLLGLYRGIPLSERGSDYGIGATLPDIIAVFQGPHEEAAKNDRELAQLIEETVRHEVAHYLGMSEEEVREWEKRRGGDF